MLRISTGLRNQWLGSKKSLRDIFNFGCAKIMLYAASALPATADAAVTGTLLATITRASGTVKAKKKIRITPTAGTANAAEWNVTLNGIKVTFVDDATPTAAEICTGLYNAIRAAIGTTSYTTPASKLNIPEIYGAFTLTDNTGTLDIEAAVAGTDFDISLSVSGAGAGTGSMAASTITEDAYGLKFEAEADVSGGIIEKLAADSWSGVAVADGVAVYGRLVLDSDTGVLSTTEPRLQGQVGVSGSDFNLDYIDLATGKTVNVSSFKITYPAAKA